MAFQTVCRVGDIPEGDSKSFTVGDKAIAVFLAGGNYYAIEDHCPHQGSPLSGGYVEDGVVTCPWHAWRFRLADGAWADNPKIKIGCYSVRIEGEFVQVEVPASQAKPTPGGSA